MFLFALDVSGIDHPNHAIIMSIVNQLVMEFLLSENSRKAINPCVEDFLKNITNHYFDADFNLNLAIKATGYSPSHFRKIFKETVGVSPNTFLNQRRIERAKSLMRQEEDMSIKSIAQESGFGDADYFSRFFKKQKEYPHRNI